MANYDAYINDDEQWVWVGESPQYIDGIPLFHGGDGLYLRLDGAHGQHHIMMKSGASLGTTPPFEKPYNEYNFSYHGDRTMLVFAKRQAGTRPEPLSFTLKHGQRLIDPEFHVGTGSDQY